MPIRFWNLEYVSLAVVAILLVGCKPQPQISPPAPLPVSPTGTASSFQPIPSGATSAPESPAPGESPGAESPATSAGFSLPIGADIPPAAASGTAPNSAGPTTLNVPPLSQQPQSQPQGQQPQAQSPQIGNAPSAGSSLSPQGTSIHLSAGVAVPQSLPIGTVMAISVDYAVRGRLNPSSHYVWVIKSGAGEAVNEVALDNSGNLSAFFEKLKPEHRPFSSRIEEVTPGSKRRTVVSNEVPLQTSY